ncbi:hypothetical protein [Pedobacter sp.]|uniref:hypothetical protein n=1 Tax=Pedobacter sp. TaxID=1411316 RepID=UPI003D7F693F
MLGYLNHKIAILTGKLLLNNEDTKEMEVGKRLISIIAGAYLFQRGVRIITKSPVIALQEVLLGGFLLYNGATGINLFANRRPKEAADMRRNQIQGNEPGAIPAFV